jgi:hypothetical protein
MKLAHEFCPRAKRWVKDARQRGRIKAAVRMADDF